MLDPAHSSRCEQLSHYDAQNEGLHRIVIMWGLSSARCIGSLASESSIPLFQDHELLGGNCCDQAWVLKKSVIRRNFFVAIMVAIEFFPPLRLRKRLP